jgi:hypothetical protein
MTLTQIKKELYRRKPDATLVKVTKSGILYNTSFYDADEEGKITERISVNFLVPLHEIGDATFEPNETDAQLLIRYIINNE